MKQHIRQFLLFVVVCTLFISTTKASANNDLSELQTEPTDNSDLSESEVESTENDVLSESQTETTESSDLSESEVESTENGDLSNSQTENNGLPESQTNIPGNSNLTESQATIIVNNQKLEFTNPILLSNSSILLPMRAYFEAIGAQVSWNSETHTATALRKGKRIDLTINAMTAEVDGKSFPLTAPAILYKQQTYIPLRFVGESFGGTVSWYADTKTADIRFNEEITSTLMSEVLPIHNEGLPLPTLIENSQFADERRLLVSDNPERFSSKTIRYVNSILSIDTVKTTNEKMEHRIFGWHINELGKKAQLGIVIENKSKKHTLTIQKVLESTFHSTEKKAVMEVGLPLAESMLLNKMASPDTAQIVIGPGETKVISSYALQNKQLIGIVTDLDIAITGEGEAQYIVRTVLSTARKPKLEEIKSPLVAIDKIASHPRGVWPSSTLQAQLPAYSIGSEQVGYSFSNGKTDHFFSKENALSDSKKTVENPGHFGASYKVQIPIVNDSKKRKGVIIKLAGRGGTYSGIIQYRGQLYMIPPIKAGSQHVQLPVYYTSKKNDVIELEFIHAGGSSLPVAIYIESK